MYTKHSLKTESVWQMPSRTCDRNSCWASAERIAGSAVDFAKTLDRWHWRMSHKQSTRSAVAAMQSFVLPTLAAGTRQIH